MTHFTSKVTSQTGEPNIAQTERSTPLSEKAKRAAPTHFRHDKEATAYEIGDVLTGRVSGIHDYGCFVRLPNGESGLVLKHHVCWPGQKITVELGDEVFVRVISFKTGRGLSLSMRDARTQELFDEFVSTHGLRSVVQGQIKSVLDYGVFVTVAPGVYGLLHVSSIPNIELYGRASIGQQIEVQIVFIDATLRRIRLELT